MPERALRDRLLQRTALDGACWLWLGARSKNGYGTLSVAGRTRYAHRVAYELFNGLLHIGDEVDHLCANRACINPAHLEAVGHCENVARAAARRREVAYRPQ